MIDWNKSTFTKADYKAVLTIVDRVEALANLKVDRMSVMMDIEAANIVCPLDLEKLTSFDDASLMHDVVGIANHLNRDTGTLEDCFLPRCSK